MNIVYFPTYAFRQKDQQDHQRYLGCDCGTDHYLDGRAVPPVYLLAPLDILSRRSVDSFSMRLELDPYETHKEAHKWSRRLYAFAALAAAVSSFTALIGYDLFIPFEEAETVVTDETFKFVSLVTGWTAAGGATLGLIAEILQKSAENELLERIDRASADR